MKLRQYQKDLIFSLRGSISRGNKRIVPVLPTGGGKTFTFTAIIDKALQKGSKALILTDRIELLRQAGGALDAYKMTPIVLEAGSRPYLGGNLYTAMVETLYRRLKKKDYQFWLKNIDLIIIDEAHMRNFNKIFPFINPDTVVLGFTATPSRRGRKGQMGEFYEDLVVGVEIEYLIEHGFLAHPKYYGIPFDMKGIKKVRGDFDQDEVAKRFSKNKIYRGVAENLKEKANNTKTLCFAPNISASLELVEELSKHFKEVRHLDSTMSKNDRENVLKWFHNTSNGILSNVGILTKGFDEPSIETIVLYRATDSLTLYLQMVGRGSRTTAFKDSFTILDFGENITRHGFWHDVRTWSLEVLPDKDKKEGEAVLKNCKKCEAFIPVNTVQCPYCGFIDEKEREEQELIMLQELHPSEMRKRAKNMSIDEKVKACKHKLIKPSWVIHQMKPNFDDVIEFVEKMNYSPYWYEYNFERYWWKDEFLKRRREGKMILRVK